ncbi:MAG: alpha/beta hydrolase [Bryobacteraceae bacterium]
MIFVSILLGLVLCGVVYQRAGAAYDRRRYPGPGETIQANGVQLHMYSMGQGTPAVLFESGISASSVNWTNLQRELSRETEAVAYDRAGLAWSGACPGPRSPEQIIAELQSVTAKIPKPFVFVGHSFGCLIGRIYASRFPDDLCGLVLIDPALTSEWSKPSTQRRQMLARGVRLSRRGAWLCHIGFVRFCLTLLSHGARALPKLLARASSGNASGVLDRLVGEVRKMPSELWPSIRSHWCRPESFESMAAHLASLPAMSCAAEGVNDLGLIPVVVISGAHLTSTQRAEHAAVAATSSRGIHLNASRGGHWVQLDEPELVLAAIRGCLR